MRRKDSGSLSLLFQHGLTDIGDDLAEVDSVPLGEVIAAINFHFIRVEW